MHPSRVRADGKIKIAAKLGEFCDGWREPFRLLETQSHEYAPENDIIPTVRFRIHPQRNVCERRDQSLGASRAGPRLVHARYYSQQRCFSGAIVSDNAEPVAVAELQVDAVEGANDHGAVVR